MVEIFIMFHLPFTVSKSNTCISHKNCIFFSFHKYHSSESGHSAIQTPQQQISNTIWKCSICPPAIHKTFSTNPHSEVWSVAIISWISQKEKPNHVTKWYIQKNNVYSNLIWGLLSVIPTFSFKTCVRWIICNHYNPPCHPAVPERRSKLPRPQGQA